MFFFWRISWRILFCFNLNECATGQPVGAGWTAYIRVCPDIAVSNIVSSRHDIVSFFPISDPILVISAFERFESVFRRVPPPAVCTRLALSGNHSLEGPFSGVPCRRCGPCAKPPYQSWTAAGLLDLTEDACRPDHRSDHHHHHHHLDHCVGPLKEHLTEQNIQYQSRNYHTISAPIS